MTPEDFDRFLEQLEPELELAPWQRAFLEAAHTGQRVQAIMPRPSAGKRQAMDLCAAMAIADGTPVHFVASSRAQAEANRRRALDVLDRLDRLTL
jgi:hypothetical protein